MKIVEPTIKILSDLSDDGIRELQLIEKVGRTCYKSEDRITEDGESAKKFVKMLINNGHEAMIEFGNITVQFEVDRGVTHELVRHRLASWAQESTRYVNYSKGKFGSEITVINPEGAMIIDGMSEEQRKEMMKIWALAMENAESSYMKAVSSNVKPQIARQVLPNSVKATINMSANYREWRSFFKLRCASDAHPSMRQVSIPLLKYLQQRIPVIFDDIKCAPNTIKINDDGTMDTDVYASIIY